GSFNSALVEAARELAPAAMRIELGAIGDLPLYNADLDADGGPPPVRRLKDQVSAADGLLIATPEYNYGIPGGLKNAIDWVSRPAFRSPLAHKPVAIMGATISAAGTARAQGQLKQVLLGTLSEVFPHPEVLVAHAQTRFDAERRLTDQATRDALATMLERYAAWLRRGR